MAQMARADHPMLNKIIVGSVLIVEDHTNDMLDKRAKI
jgi:hypothetical protein